MDFQRILLIGALGVISYIMMLQWNEDYGPTAVDPTQVTSVSAYQEDTVSTDFAINTGKQEVASTNNTDQTQAQATLVAVTTDALQVTIDTRGGDIIQASLAKYLAEMDHPDVSFTL
ncbi:MAG: membrane protein insertase YidC, partial [Gammaproteobacteria bacterium]|nr:membrane protein insertase YidC [Gammaproteobacteria bacterium]